MGDSIAEGSQAAPPDDDLLALFGDFAASKPAGNAVFIFYGVKVQLIACP
jgi:hypothetical protein